MEAKTVVLVLKDMCGRIICSPSILICSLTHHAIVMSRSSQFYCLCSVEQYECILYRKSFLCISLTCTTCWSTIMLGNWSLPLSTFKLSSSFSCVYPATCCNHIWYCRCIPLLLILPLMPNYWKLTIDTE